MQANTYTVTFDRVGQRRDVPPLTVAANRSPDLAKKVYDYVAEFLGSKPERVTLGLEPSWRGEINDGALGTFTITKVRETS